MAQLILREANVFNGLFCKSFAKCFPHSKAQKYAHAGGIHAQVIESKVMGGE